MVAGATNCPDVLPVNMEDGTQVTVFRDLLDGGGTGRTPSSRIYEYIFLLRGEPLLRLRYPTKVHKMSLQ
jgi:hypothetical protein